MNIIIIYNYFKYYTNLYYITKHNNDFNTYILFKKVKLIILNFPD